jgi:carbon starvation protein CstA
MKSPSDWTGPPPQVEDNASIDMDESSSAVFAEMESGVQQREVLAKRETSAVARFKVLLVLVLTASTVGAAVAVQRYTHRSEIAQFEERFKMDALNVQEAIGSSIDKTLGSFDSLAVSLVSFAKNTNATWPYVTQPNFAVRNAKLLRLTNVMYINVLPIVHPTERLQWEKYSVQEDYWVNQSMEAQEKWDGYRGPVIYDWEQPRKIHGIEDLPYNLR